VNAEEVKADLTGDGSLPGKEYDFPAATAQERELMVLRGLRAAVGDFLKVTCIMPRGGDSICLVVDTPLAAAVRLAHAYYGVEPESDHDSTCPAACWDYQRMPSGPCDCKRGA